MSFLGRSFWLDFAKLNGAVVAVFTALLAADAETKAVIWEYRYYLFAAVFIIEVAGFFIIHKIHYSSPQEEDDGKLDGDSLHKEALEVRFADEGDLPGTHRVYDQWFTDSVSIDDVEYHKIVQRRNTVRVAEATICDGNTKENKIVGYYSVWGLKRLYFEQLCSGKLREQDITADMVVDFSSSDCEFIYIPEICIMKGWDVGPILLRDLLRYAVKILIEHPQIEAVGAWPYTKFGRRLVKGYRMKPATGRRFFQKVYVVSRSLALTIPAPKGPFKEKVRLSY